RLRLRREVLRPVPLVQQLLAEGVAVGVALGVEAAARVAVPVPGAADPGAGLEHPHPLADLPEAIDLVEAGDAGADDDGVEVEIARCHRACSDGSTRRASHGPWPRESEADQTVQRR